MEDDGLEIRIVIETEDYFDSDDLYAQKECLYINGEYIESNGNPILAILEHLGFNATVDIY